MTDDRAPQPPRRVLLNGESLRAEVGPPRRAPGNDKYQPRTAAEAGVLLSPMVREVDSTAQKIPSTLRAANHLYVEARLLPNYIAATYFPTTLFEHIEALPVGTRADVSMHISASKRQLQGTKRIILAIRDQGLTKFSSLLAGQDKSRESSPAFEQINRIDLVELPSRRSIIKKSPASEVRTDVWEAVLNPSPGAAGDIAPLDSETLGKWIDLVQRLGGSVFENFVREIGGLTFAPIKLDYDVIDEVGEFNPLRTVRPMPQLPERPRSIWTFGSQVFPPNAEETEAARKSKLQIAVFDGGIQNEHEPSDFFPNPAIDLTDHKPDDDDLIHGTRVTGAVMYGLVKNGEKVTRVPASVHSYRVLPIPVKYREIANYWVLDQIVETLNEEIFDIVHLSYGAPFAVEDDQEPNRWTLELDRLAWEKHILFVIAAGNGGSKPQDSGLHRVQAPADMVNGISVGACTVPAPHREWQRAAYSSMGPGRQGATVQPTCVQFGGTDSLRFPAMYGSGVLGPAFGTSLAAPVVTNTLAWLAARLPSFDANLLRAFVAHKAERHRRSKQLIDEVGFGRMPLKADELLDCGPDKATVLFRDEISREETIGYQIPLPYDLTGKIIIDVTLSYMSPTDPTQPFEYTLASIGMSMRPHSEIYTFTEPENPHRKTRTTKVDHRTAEAVALLTDGWRRSQNPAAKPLGQNTGKSEFALRESGKWENLRHYRVSLKEGEYLEPKLVLSLLGRKSGAIDHGPSVVPFALIVSIKSVSGNFPLYDRVLEEFGTLRVLDQSMVQVRL